MLAAAMFFRVGLSIGLRVRGIDRFGVRAEDNSFVVGSYWRYTRG